MALSQIDAAAANLGKFLQIVYSNGTIGQLSEDHRDWEMVSKQKVSDEAARAINFMVQKSFGVPAVQWSKQGSGGSFPTSSQSTHEELSAGFNQLYSTVELEYDLWQRALGSPHKYAEPLAIEIQSKGVVQKRLLSAAFHLDGTGDFGTLSASALSSGDGQFTFSAGGARYMEYGDRFSVVNVDGTLVDIAAGSGTVTDSWYEVVDKSRENNTVTCQLYGTSAAVTFVEATHGITGPLTVGDRFIRFGSTAVDKSGTYFTAGSLEVNDMAEIMPGLPSLTANDGRKLHGMTMSGITSGTKYTASGAVDISHLQAGMDKLKTITGEGVNKYKQVLSAPETLAAFIESQETDRRLVNINDNKRGQKGFGYIHNNDTLELVTSEFNADASMWCIPEGSKQSGILELHGKDFVEVKAGSQGEFLKASGSGGYSPYIQKFMMAYMTLICKRPNAILEINGFTN